MTDKANELWKEELSWIKDPVLRDKTAKTWALALEKSVLTVSTVLEGEFGLSGVCLGVPAAVGEAGVERIFEMALPPEEQAALERSASILKQTLADLDPSTSKT